MNEEMVQQLMATAERLANAAESLDRVLGRVDAQQDALYAKVDRIVAAVDDRSSNAPADSDATRVLQERVAELEKSNNDLKAQTARMRSLIDNDVEPVIFHCRIQIFFNGRLQPMDLVDEEHIAFFQTGEKPGELAGFFDDRSAGIFDVHIHGVGDDVG